jgi:hypothetical protein
LSCGGALRLILWHTGQYEHYYNVHVAVTGSATLCRICARREPLSLLSECGPIPRPHQPSPCEQQRGRHLLAESPAGQDARTGNHESLRVGGCSCHDNFCQINSFGVIDMQRTGLGHEETLLARPFIRLRSFLCRPSVAEPQLTAEGGGLGIAAPSSLNPVLYRPYSHARDPRLYLCSGLRTP